MTQSFFYTSKDIFSNGASASVTEVEAREKLKSWATGQTFNVTDSDLNAFKNSSGGNMSFKMVFAGSILKAYQKAHDNYESRKKETAIEVFRKGSTFAATYRSNGDVWYQFTDGYIDGYYYSKGEKVMWFAIYVDKYKGGSFLNGKRVWVPIGTINKDANISFIKIGSLPNLVDNTPGPQNTVSKESERREEEAKQQETQQQEESANVTAAQESVVKETATDEWADNFTSLFYEDDKDYFNDLYWFKKQTYSAKSFNSIVGMPVQFMGNVDMRFGSSTFGKQYTEDILYDAPICVIQPGAPSLNSTSFMSDEDEKGSLKSVVNGLVETISYMNAIKAGQTKDVLKTLLTDTLAGDYSRFYGFQSEYSRYIQYVNTLCHLFSSFLGISDLTIPGTNKKYRNYNDTIEEVEYLDNGLGLKMLYGNYPALFVYYQPDSSLSQSFQNTTQESSLASKMKEVSNYSKEVAFLAGGLGIANGKGVTIGSDVDAGSLFGLSDTQFSFTGNNLLKRVFSRASEGVGTIIGGNNLSLPEIYSDSTMSGTEYTLNIKLVNPYGTPEGAFLFQMRQLARLLAISLPRQYGPNGYTAPFILRAFSKGQFNVQLGIVDQLQIRRAGSAGENQTVHDIPMELEVTMVIKDLYNQIALSNEYTSGILDVNNTKQLKLLFNNIGLLDFIASYAGYNMNQPAIDMQFDYIKDSMWNNLTDIVDFNGSLSVKDWKFPRWKRSVVDSFKNAVEDKTTWLSK